MEASLEKREIAKPQTNTGVAFSLALMDRENVKIRASLACIGGETGRIPLPKLQAALHPLERPHFSRLKPSYQGFGHLMARWVCKSAASLYLDEPEKTRIAVTLGIFNQPIVQYHLAEPPEVTFSHTRDFALGIAYQPGYVMGVDVESQDLKRQEIASRQLTVKERRLVGDGLLDSGSAALLFWTVKESLAKALKCEKLSGCDAFEVEHLLQLRDGSYRTYFTNFPPFHCQSWIFGSTILSISFPRTSQLSLDISRIREAM